VRVIKRQSCQVNPAFSGPEGEVEFDLDDQVPEQPERAGDAAGGGPLAGYPIPSGHPGVRPRRPAIEAGPRRRHRTFRTGPVWIAAAVALNGEGVGILVGVVIGDGEDGGAEAVGSGGGSKVTWKVVSSLAAREEAAGGVKAKSVAWGPLNATLGSRSGSGERCRCSGW